MRDIELIIQLVGNVTEQQLRYVDYAFSEDMGLCMPIAGPCYYAISTQHTHPSYSFIYTFDNCCRLKIGNKVITSTHGMVYAISPDVPHQELESEIQPRYIAVFISAPYFEKQLELYEIREKPCFQADCYQAKGDIANHMKEFISEYEAASPGYQKLMEANCLKITHFLIRMIYGSGKQEQNFTDRISVNRVISFMHSHYGEKLTVTDMARVAYLSVSHFARLFKRETGSTPIEYFHRLRLDIAKRMIRGGEASLTEIALKCGFNSSSYFSTCFARTFKMTPSEFKKRFAKAES
jgi:AraC family transcriptional regulator